MANLSGAEDRKQWTAFFEAGPRQWMASLNRVDEADVVGVFPNAKTRHVNAMLAKLDPVGRRAAA
jgi:hypothetical protein